MTDTDDRPTHETALVGIVLHRASILDDTEVQTADFADLRCQAVWGAATRLRTAGKPVTPVTVLAACREDRGVTAPWLAEIYGAAPAAGAAHYAGLVIDAATRRRLYAAASRVVQLTTTDMPAQEIVENARAEIDTCTRTVADTAWIADHIDATLDSYSAAPNHTPTPWTDLNHLIGGWRPGALYVIGARPGSGKTMLSTQAAVELARTGCVALNNLEMSRDEIQTRIVAQIAGIPLSRLINRRLTPADWESIASHRAEIGALGLSIDDSSTARPIDIRSHARTVARTGDLRAIVVDYIQLMGAAPGDRRPRHEVVAQFSRELKILAKELHVPVLVLAQLNRESTNGAGRHPLMSDLKESGALEQDADVVLLLHVAEDDNTILDVGVAKNRHGQTGSLRLLRRGHLARLDDLAWKATA